MKLEDTIILAANTARSNAYAQAMVRGGIKLKTAIIFGEDKPKAGQTDHVPEKNWPASPVYLPDLGIPLQESLESASDAIKFVMTADINDPLIFKAIQDLNPKLIIYSGYGSQIVGKNLLDKTLPFLHIHSGWLPDYRGSTTTYYHILNKDNCGVSAILLEKEIDTGPILLRKSYPKPPGNIDIDYLYDCAIRADLLIDVLNYYGENDKLPDGISQSQEQEGDVYYIIHPVLKHIAILSKGKNL